MYYECQGKYVFAGELWMKASKELCNLIDQKYCEDRTDFCLKHKDKPKIANDG